MNFEDHFRAESDLQPSATVEELTVAWQITFHNFEGTSFLFLFLFSFFHIESKSNTKKIGRLFMQGRDLSLNPSLILVTCHQAR
jgi:hypothetical protein